MTEHIFLIERNAGAEAPDTYELLARPETEKIIASIKNKTDISLLVFKNTPRIEAFCRGKNWKLLNPSAALAETIENKINN